MSKNTPLLQLLSLVVERRFNKGQVSDPLKDRINNLLVEFRKQYIEDDIAYNSDIRRIVSSAIALRQGELTLSHKLNDTMYSAQVIMEADNLLKKKEPNFICIYYRHDLDHGIIDHHDLRDASYGTLLTLLFSDQVYYRLERRAPINTSPTTPQDMAIAKIIAKLTPIHTTVVKSHNGWFIRNAISTVQAHKKWEIYNPTMGYYMNYVVATDKDTTVYIHPSIDLANALGLVKAINDLTHGTPFVRVWCPPKLKGLSDFVAHIKEIGATVSIDALTEDGYKDAILKEGFDVTPLESD